VARNTQLIMAGESHVDFVADPAAGSGSIEALTDALCEAAWKEFQAIDGEGGVLKSLAEGRIQHRIAEAREARPRAFREGGRTIVGTTLHPAKEERPVNVIDARRTTFSDEGAVTCEALAPQRIDVSIEGSA
jgi:methylmalonyl-CoA mutase